MNAKHISIIVAVVALLAGCAKSPIETPSDTKGLTDLELTHVGSTEVKSVINGKTFPEDGEIGLFLFKDELAETPYGESGYSNVKYAYNSSKQKWTASPSIKVGSDPGYLYGYYPYNSESTDVKEIPVNSSLNGDDVMYASKQVEPITDKTASSTSIVMNHALARVSITIKNNGYTGEAKLSKIKFGGAKTAENGTLNALDGKITATNSDVTLDVPTTEQTITATGTTYECLLVPSGEDDNKQTVTLTLTIDGEYKTATLSGDNGVIIAKGTKSNITIDLSNSGISVQTVSVEDWNVVEVGGHRVTVKFDEGVNGIKKDVWVMAYEQDGDVIIKSYSNSGKTITCQLDDDTMVESIPDGNLSVFTLPSVSKDIVATIGVWREGGRREITIGGHKINVVYDEVKDIEEDVWVMAYAENGNAVIEAESSSDKPVKCVKDGERIAGSKTGTLYKFTISDITDNATVTIGYSKYTATIGFTQGSVTDKATLKINGDEVEAGGSISVFEGTNVEYSAEADDGYRVYGWYDNNGQKISDAESFTVSRISSDVAYYAEVKGGCILTVNTIYAGTSTITANGVSIESGRAYYYEQNTQITLTASPATECDFVKWCDEDGKTLSIENPYSFTLSDNLTITSVFEFEPEDALSGVFSVSGNKKVRFSKGNLWYGKVGDASEATFNFEANQYDVPPLTSDNETESHIGHFYWSKYATVASSLLNYTDSGAPATDVFFTNDSENQAKPNLGFTVNGQTGFWRVLSGGANGEWKYLINYNDECGTTVRSGKYKYGVTVCGKTNCLVLLPDDWKWGENGVGTDWQDGGYPETSTDKVTWQTMETAGAVCLPAAGYRIGMPGIPTPALVNNVGDYGYYWSASPYDFIRAYDLRFYSDNVDPLNSDARDRAQSVRLVTEVK
ncbi:MAG: fimbrillin family protein [Bacteroidaceae bacterium]|nr:fimbrillin family protein [Bacteroidaceae bacterium]